MKEGIKNDCICSRANHRRKLRLCAGGIIAVWEGIGWTTERRSRGVNREIL